MKNFLGVKDYGGNAAVFAIFSMWTVILLCRPQDYLTFMGPLRPTLLVGIITLIIYFFGAPYSEKLSDSNQFRWFIFFVALMVIEVPFSYYRRASLIDVLNYASVHIPFFFLFYQIVNSLSRLKVILFICCCGAAIYASSIMIFGNIYDGRIMYGNMFDPNDIAFFLICFIPFNFLFINKNNYSIVRLISLVNLIISLIVLLKSGSRSGFLAFLVVFLYLLFMSNRALDISFYKKVFVSLACIIVLFSYNMFSDRYSTILDYEDDYNFTEETGRVSIWKIGVRLMMNRPLTGIGMNRFNEGVGRDRERRGLLSTWQSAHNSFVQVGAETGLIGLFVFCLMSFRVFSITGKVGSVSSDLDLVKISEMARAGFLGHIVCAMFLSQAYSVYWIFYIILSAVVLRMLEKEQSSDACLTNESGLYPYTDHLRRS